MNISNRQNAQDSALNFNQGVCMPCIFMCQPCQPFLPCNQPVQSPVNPQVVQQYVPAKKPQSVVKKEFVPFQKKVVEYVEEEIQQRVPVQRKIIVMQEKRAIQKVPIERKITDYYRVQIHREFVEKQVTGQRVQKVPVKKIIKKPIYIPIQKEIVHMPREGQAHSYESHRRAQGYQMGHQNLSNLAMARRSGPYQQRALEGVHAGNFQRFIQSREHDLGQLRRSNQPRRNIIVQEGHGERERGAYSTLL